MQGSNAGISTLMLYLSIEVAAIFGAPQGGVTPEPTPNVERVVSVAASSKARSAFFGDPSWDAFVFAAAAGAIALELALPEDEFAPSGNTSWAFQAPAPQFDFLAALTATGLSNYDDHWLS
jgi:hypothetical protein